MITEVKDLPIGASTAQHVHAQCVTIRRRLDDLLVYADVGEGDIAIIAVEILAAIRAIELEHQLPKVEAVADAAE